MKNFKNSKFHDPRGWGSNANVGPDKSYSEYELSSTLL